MSEAVAPETPAPAPTGPKLSDRTGACTVKRSDKTTCPCAQYAKHTKADGMWPLCTCTHTQHSHKLSEAHQDSTVVSKIRRA